MRRWASGTGAGRAALAWDSRPSTDRDLSLSFRQSLWHLTLGRHGRAAPRETLAGLATNEDGGRCGWIAGARDRSAEQHPRGVQPDIRQHRLEGHRQDRQGHRRGIAAQGLGRPGLPRIRTGTVRSGGRLSISSPTTPNCSGSSATTRHSTSGCRRPCSRRPGLAVPQLRRHSRMTARHACSFVKKGVMEPTTGSRCFITLRQGSRVAQDGESATSISRIVR